MMVEFIEILCLEDLENIKKLFITKELMNRGTVQIGTKYFSINEMEKTYIVNIKDSNKRKIVNSIYSKRWFDNNVIEKIKEDILGKYNRKTFIV